MSWASTLSPRRLDLRSLWVWLVPLMLYLAVGIPLTVINRDKLNPDAVAYIRRGIYIAQGEWSASVSGYWSPLISWTMAPLIAMGVDSVHAAHVALFAWGAVFVLILHVFLRTITNWERGWRMLALCVLALVILPSTVLAITPDLILAACLFAYFSGTVGPDFLTSRRVQMITGLFGGLAYLAKSYALPFLILHLPASVVLRYLAERRAAVTRGAAPPRPMRAVSALLVTGIGVALLAGPWIGVLSMHYGRLTTSTSGPIAHSLLRPFWMVDESKARENEWRKLHPTPDPYIAHHENPESSVWIEWSPTQSEALFRHQVRIVRDHLLKSVGIIDTFDLLPVGLVALALSPLLMLGFPRLAGVARWKIIWVIGTIVAYCSGFLLVWLIARYIELIVVPLLVVLCIWIVRGIDRPATHEGEEQIPPPAEPLVRYFIRIGLALLVLVCFAWPAVVETRDYLHRAPLRAYRNIAIEMQKHGLSGPIAATDSPVAMYVGLYLDQKTLTIPRPILADPDWETSKEQALQEAQPGVIIVWTKPRTDGLESGSGADATSGIMSGQGEPIEYTTDAYARDLATRWGWVRRFRIRERDYMAEVFAPPPEPAAVQTLPAEAP